MTEIVIIHTEYAGVENSKRHIKKSEKIAKKFNARVLRVSDKGVTLEIEDFFSFRAEMRAEQIDYLMEKLNG